MIPPGSSNLLSPRGKVLLDLAVRYLIEMDFSQESVLGEAVDEALTDEDEDTFQMVSALLYDRNPESAEDFLDYSRERAEMFLFSSEESSTLFAVPILGPELLEAFSAEDVTESFYDFGILCEQARVTFYPAPVDGGHILHLSPVELFRLHLALRDDYRTVARMLPAQEFVETHPYVCFIGVVTQPTESSAECVAWEKPTDEYIQRVQHWSESSGREVLGIPDGGRILGYPGRLIFALREGAQEYQDIILHDFIDKVAGRKKVFARLRDHAVLEALILELYEGATDLGSILLPWKLLGQNRADVIEEVFDLLRESNVLGIMFYEENDSVLDLGIRH